jgi:hypothetical protein
MGRTNVSKRCEISHPANVNDSEVVEKVLILR